MSVAYRVIRPEDEPAVLDLWADALAEDREQLEREWLARGAERLTHTQVAVASEGSLLAASTFTVQDVHDASGRPCRVGQLKYLATDASARSQGHGSRLLEETVAALRRAECTWTLTWTLPAIRGFYTRRGWQAFGLPVCEGEAATGLPDHVPACVVRLYDPTREPRRWAPLAAVYAADSAHRPLTAIRDSAYWESHIAAGLREQQSGLRPPAVVLVAARPADPTDVCGYVIVHLWDMHENTAPGWFEVSELCTRPGNDDAIVALLTAVTERAAAQDRPMRHGRLFLPKEHHIEAAAAHVLLDPEWSDFATLLARPIAPEVDAAWLEALFTAPSAICWSLDVL